MPSGLEGWRTWWWEGGGSSWHDVHHLPFYMYRVPGRSMTIAGVGNEVFTIDTL